MECTIGHLDPIQRACIPPPPPSRACHLHASCCGVELFDQLVQRAKLGVDGGFEDAAWGLPVLRDRHPERDRQTHQGSLMRRLDLWTCKQKRHPKPAYMSAAVSTHKAFWHQHLIIWGTFMRGLHPINTESDWKRARDKQRTGTRGLSRTTGGTRAWC
jgi:hypothetical protein